MNSLSKEDKTAIISQLQEAIDAINASNLNAAEMSALDVFNRICWLKAGGQ